jgi:hypothetical protein
MQDVKHYVVFQGKEYDLIQAVPDGEAPSMSLDVCAARTLFVLHYNKEVGLDWAEADGHERFCPNCGAGRARFGNWLQTPIPAEQADLPLIAEGMERAEAARRFHLDGKILDRINERTDTLKGIEYRGLKAAVKRAQTKRNQIVAASPTTLTPDFIREVAEFQVRIKGLEPRLPAEVTLPTRGRKEQRFVYINVDGHGSYKFGRTGDPEQRQKGLMTGNSSGELTCVNLMDCLTAANAKKVEEYLLSRYIAFWPKGGNREWRAGFRPEHVEEIKSLYFCEKDGHLHFKHRETIVRDVILI